MLNFVHRQFSDSDQSLSLIPETLKEKVFVILEMICSKEKVFVILEMICSS